MLLGINHNKNKLSMTSDFLLLTFKCFEQHGAMMSPVLVFFFFLVLLFFNLIEH